MASENNRCGSCGNGGSTHFKRVAERDCSAKIRIMDEEDVRYVASFALVKLAMLTGRQPLYELQQITTFDLPAAHRVIDQRKREARDRMAASDAVDSVAK